MSLRFGINGFGRIGRALLRIVLTREDLPPGLEPAAVNDIVSAPILARLLARDSVHGPFSLPVRAEGDTLIVGELRIPVFHEPDPALVPWGEAGVESVVEATGRFLQRGQAAAHLRDGVRTVLLSANSDPEEPADVTLCRGIAEDWDPERQTVASNASCTTNALALVAKVLHDRFGVRRALMSTVHSYTENQRLLDLPHPDPRRSRAAALNIIPTSTTAAQGAGLLLPELAGRIDGFSVRVPTPAVAMLDLVADLARETAAEEIRQAYMDTAAGALAGLLGVTEDEPVSSDFLGDPRSAVVDLPLIQTAGSLTRVVAWYDNEWGYSNRLAELLARLTILRENRGGSDA
ncbi:MAG TPA: glyceraldehyde 3-phosphate dehydrogenase NAD-binding domain-containing protein [Thermoanaerobaculia bacterium]|nr:glyceraldehyde 3-phosphate dehydrogenase NAD-binding domain-containing protein [Thermoanaerobaculia bacterium]